MSFPAEEKNKQKRLQEIKELIETGTISSQDDLLVRLRNMGYSTTQATLSRDMKEIKVAKVPTGNGYKYMLSEHAVPTNAKSTAPNTKLIQPASISVEISGQICILRTLPGYASAIAATVDALQIKGVMGSLAGDDTIIIALSTNANHQLIIKSLKTVFQDISVINAI
ncbi:MAG: hypothetical protein HUJ96_05350 [Marinilabiliaceae bacterium]|nr:hypothetical protein [Marinilabiliaceae bacterium]